MVDKRHLDYVFLDIDDVELWREAPWLCRTRATLVQMHNTPASIEPKWDLSFPKMDRCVVVGYFAVCNMERKYPQWLTLEGISDVCDFSRVFSNCSGRCLCSPDKCWQDCLNLCKSRLLGHGPCALSMLGFAGAQFPTWREDNWQTKQGQKGYKVFVVEEATICQTERQSSWDVGRKDRSCFVYLTSMLSGSTGYWHWVLGPDKDVTDTWNIFARLETIPSTTQKRRRPG